MWSTDFCRRDSSIRGAPTSNTVRSCCSSSCFSRRAFSPRSSSLRRERSSGSCSASDVRERVQQTVRFVVAREGDTRHAERTAAVLRELGADEELILAGLLHDRGKPSRTKLWHRVAGVVLARLAPALRERIARGESTFALYLDHARRGAAQAQIEG